MQIDHLAFWVDDLDKMKDFYLAYFNCTVGEKYTNPKKHYTSYFISFGKHSSRIELMNQPGIASVDGQRGTSKGIAHVCISVGDKEKVNELTALLRNDGYTIYSEPRTTGDGYYESVVLDPEGNYLEISA